MPKGVIILLVVVAMVFVVVLAMGGRNHRDSNAADPKDPPGVVSALDELGGAQPLLIEGDVSTDCENAQGNTLTVDGQCRISVPERGAFSRPIEAALRPQSGGIDVVYSPNEGERQDGPAPNSDSLCFQTAVDRKGGLFELTCQGGGECPVVLGKEGCG
jgi:hypothetical protein